MHLSGSQRIAAHWLLAAFLAGAVVPAARAQDDADAVAVRTGFAARISEMAQNWLRTGSLSAPLLQQSAAMLQAAMRSDPRDTRYPRLLASANADLNDVDGQIAAWNAYRRLVPEDRVAAVRVIELYVWKLDTADKKLNYLKGLVGNAKLPPEVRAHLAALCVPLLLDRSNDDALAMIAQGLKLYPLPALLQWQYQLVTRQGTPLERIRGLLGLLRSNPIQPLVADAIARELAAAGMPEDSAEWFSTEFGITQRMGLVNDQQFYVNLVSELFQAGQFQAAQQWIGKVLGADNANVELWFMQLTLQRSNGDQQGYIETTGPTRDALWRRWAQINTLIAGKTPGAPATQPAEGETPDPVATLRKLRAIRDPKLNEAFALLMEDIAWFDLFYVNDAKSAEPVLHALEQALPADNVTLQRLQGWYLAEIGKGDDARQRLAAAADSDPFAALGLIRLDRAKDPPHTRDKLRQLLHDHPTGLEAAVIREALLSEEAPPPATNPTTGPAASEPSPAPATAPATAPGNDPAVVDAIRAELKNFPTTFLSLIDQPQLFYSVDAEPLKTTLRFGDPLMARVTLTNRSDRDLVIGFGGPIAPAIWIDAKVSGIAQEELPAVSNDQITGQIVLRAHGSTSQVVRVDQGELGELLRQRANGSMIVSGDVMTNASRFGQGIAPGAGGQSVVFGRSFVRLPNELQTAAAQRELREDFVSGSADDRMHDLDLMASFVAGMDKETDAAIRGSADLFIHYIIKARSDATPEVAAWAGYLAATLPGLPGRSDTIDEMLRGAAWQTRLLGLAAARLQPAAAQQRLCGPVAAGDADPVVKALAAAIVDASKLPPTTAPATAPSAPPQ